MTVVVGGVEFQHYSQLLCLSSEYFDAALHSGMKEMTTKRIELVDKDPEEWNVEKLLNIRKRAALSADAADDEENSENRNPVPRKRSKRTSEGD